MPQQVIGREVYNLVSVNSTNEYLRRMMDQEKISEGTVVIAADQHRGKGYGQNVWISKRGQNLTFSLVIYPDFLTTDNQFLVSKAISLGISDFLNLYVDDVKIKWPNDIYVGNQKIGGILIENDLVGSMMKASMVGIGLNINQMEFPRRLPNPISLTQLTGRKHNLKTVFYKLLECLDHRYSMLNNNICIGKINNEYHDRLFRLNQTSWFRQGEDEFSARIIGVNDYGQLILEDQYGKPREFNFKEVEFVI